MTKLHKHFHGGVKQVDRAKREIRFVASRQEVDRDGEVILTQGISTANFRKNPVLLARHDHTFNLGRVDTLAVEQTDGADALVGVATILPAGISPEADQAYGKILAGALGGVSIGFLSLETDEKPVLPGQKGKTYRRVDLLEISIVSLPSCPSCTIIEKAWRSENLIEVDQADLGAAIRAVVKKSIIELTCAHIRNAMLRMTGRID